MQISHRPSHWWDNFPPYSEAFGRKKLYIFSSFLYSIFCVVVGVVPSLAGVAVGRFFSGFLSGMTHRLLLTSYYDLTSGRSTDDRRCRVHGGHL